MPGQVNRILPQALNSSIGCLLLAGRERTLRKMKAYQQAQKARRIL